ncbi:helix-turn-helix domain-containing protein [Streptomyces tremellae]|uniref:Helix-turn-helix domain-containing protein n=1 Tax=Streptomyces tremellae TaxID=1124239 RepID=A0ABP7ESJ5_9ACTN
MGGDAHSNELGDFLRARRGELRPADLGLAETGHRRRVAGLRREEVASLASISPDFYTRLEQGRRQPSEQVLDTLARVLGLSEEERDYAFELAGLGPARRPRPPQRVLPHLRRILDGLTTVPAVVIGLRTDILAWNPPAAALFTDFARLPRAERNFLRLVFLDPGVRSLYPEWERVAAAGVAQLRREAAQHPDDPELAALVDDLSSGDPDFRRWWAAHHVAVRGAGTHTIRHPRVGELTLDWAALVSTAVPSQQLFSWTAEPGSDSEARLRALAARA